jgi:hypothetical protein
MPGKPGFGIFIEPIALRHGTAHGAPLRFIEGDHEAIGNF